MTELLEVLVKALVEAPEAVVVEELEEDGDLVYEISVADEDLGRVIGKGGRIANAIRTIAKAAAVRIDRRVIVDILDLDGRPDDHLARLRLDVFTLFPDAFDWLRSQRSVQGRRSFSGPCSRQM